MRRGPRKREGQNNDEEEGKEKQWGRWTGTGMSNGDTEIKVEKGEVEEKKCVFSSQGGFSVPTTSFALSIIASYITAL